MSRKKPEKGDYQKLVRKMATEQFFRNRISQTHKTRSFAAPTGLIGAGQGLPAPCALHILLR